jgi:large subunit ribosomal protein L10
MQAEKQYLVDEVAAHLGKSRYVFLADFNRITVAETENLRLALAEHGAEFHVVKNRILKIAAAAGEIQGLDAYLKGQTAIVVGGKNAAGVAKALEKFFKDTKKLEIKGGALDRRVVTAADISTLAQLPPIDVLKAQLLALFNTPATRMVRIIQAVPEGLLNVLQARVDKEQAAAS